MTNDGVKQQIMAMVILYPKGYSASQFIEAIIETFSCSYICVYYFEVTIDIRNFGFLFDDATTR